ERFGSLIIESARQSSVPAGSALAVDREVFAERVTRRLAETPGLRIHREELLEIPGGQVVLATGPLTSPAMAEHLQELLGADYLYFYDAIAPIVEADSLGPRLFAGSRYGKGGDDYLNSALSREEYDAFYRALIGADVLQLRDFEQKLFFEGCLPIEEIARRGPDTLRFGPMKPVGIETPDGAKPHAVVQLRQDDLAKSQYNLVGFQSRMTWGDQKRVLRMIPGLESARFVRMGQIHRNTFINSPIHLDPFFRLRSLPRVRIAGQITGVEGYLESAATGLMVGVLMAQQSAGRRVPTFPATTALGSLIRHVNESDPHHFQPANVNYGLFDELERRVRGKDKRRVLAQRALGEVQRWIGDHLPSEDPSYPAPTAEQADLHEATAL
ncbi:MAG: methylenetetrahydrofolate--tRNA-(uracil(54)-C(5))-methyltransferase (FADH(2)-oxidizing) TrmFO, partial [Acidobacteriota bacterium]